MNWTALGKILVLVNLGLSLLFAAMAFGVYMHPLDVKDAEYVFKRASVRRDAAGKEVDVKGSIVSEDRLKQAEATKRFVDSRDAAETRWRHATEALKQVEQQRPAYQAWYADQLAILETGADTRGTAVQPVAVVLKKDPTGKFIMDRQGCPAINRRNQQNQQDEPLKAVNAYNKEHVQLDQRIKDEISAINAQIAEEKKNTDKLNGEDGKTKGLRQILAEVVAATRNSETEQEALNRLLYDPRGGDRLMTTLAEEELLLKRNRMLKARLEELKKRGVAAGQRP